MSVSNQSVTSLVDLPELIQTIATQRRSGTLTITFNGQIRRLYFTTGMIIAIGGTPPMLFIRSLTWGSLVKPAMVESLLSDLGHGCNELEFIERAQALNIVNKDVLLDALDVFTGEAMTEVVSWTGAHFEFSAQLDAEQWAAFQVKLGMQIPASGMLLEALRRIDELKSVAAFVPDPWDVLMREQGAGTTSIDQDQRFLLREWKDGTVFSELLALPIMSPFRVQVAIARMRQQNILKLGGAMEVVAQADIANAHEQYPKAFQLYLRAVQLGMESARIHLHIAELADKIGDAATSARYYVSAASMLADPGSSVIALRNALRLGAEKEDPLIQLYGIYQHLGEKDDAVSVLLELAELYYARGAHDQAAQATREAQELGADPAACASILARIAMAEGDSEQAVLQLELVARAAEDRGRHEDAATALSSLCRLQPKRFDHAHKFADVLARLGRGGEAVKEIDRILIFRDEAAEEVLIGLFELKAQLDPSDQKAHQWLADAYRRRKNREGATSQLQLLAAAQEREGHHQELAQTLERILEVGGDMVDVLKRLALVYSRLGMDSNASETLARAVDAALELGLIKDARTMCELALDLDPTSLSLRTRYAQVANRDGDRETAEAQFRAAADLARGQGKADVAAQQLVQLRKLRPDDLVVRIEIAQLAEVLQDSNLDLILRDLVVFAVRGKNQGIALDIAKKRVERAEGPARLAARDELVELHRRMGDNAAELKLGKELLDDLLADGEFERALALLQRLVASNPRTPDLVLQLAEVSHSLDDLRSAHRFWRHGLSLLQMEGRVDEARAVLEHLVKAGEDIAVIAAVRELLERGQAVDWDAIKLGIEQDQRRRIAGEIALSDKFPTQR